MLNRTDYLHQLQQAIDRSRIVLLAGARQCGKTTLARRLLSVDSANYFDLENPTDLARLDDPMTALSPLKGLVVIDEVQRRPELFPVLRVLADRDNQPACFLVLGSASGELQRQTSESLAGRVERLTLSGFGMHELESNDDESTLWLRGGFPLSYLANNDEQSLQWRKSFAQTLVERDLPTWGVRVPTAALLRFWAMVSHYHGQTWQSAEPASSMGVDQKTVRRYLDILTDAFMVRQLQPYFANIKKRQVKSPKIYIRDSGILHERLGIDTQKALLQHPKLGASWEGFLIEQILARVYTEEAYFWATHQGAEIDLLINHAGLFVGIEFKRTDTPSMTPSIRNALSDLELDRVVVIYPGAKRFPLAENVEAVPSKTIAMPGNLFSLLFP